MRAEHVTIKEAAERLGVSQDTIRRRLKTGELAGEREKTRQGFVWRVALPPEFAQAPAAAEPAPAASDAVELAQLRERVAGLERLADELKSERDAWREQAARDGDAARELRIMLQHAQTYANALPAGIPSEDVSTLISAERSEPEAQPADAPASLWDRLRIRLGIG